tara:strand:+ start:1404 stop:2162 length:759 start_codon:yes stop_codon:yes gene_type:complete
MGEIFILSIVQGISEFIPVSSSSHLIIISEIFNFTNQSFSIDVSLHIGSFIAVIYYFRKELLDFFHNKKLFLRILISSLPVMIVGYFLTRYELIHQLRSIKIIGWTTIIFGIFLFLSDKFENKKKLKDNFDIKSAFFIGLLQILSLVPGVSRSGIAITASRFLKFDRSESAKISFFLSIPILAAVSVYGLNNILTSDSSVFSSLNLIAIFLSFVFSYFTIKYFLIYLKKFNLNIFVLYRILLGLLVLIFAYL